MNGIGFFLIYIFFLRRFGKIFHFYKNLVFLENYATDFQKREPIEIPPTPLFACIIV